MLRFAVCVSTICGALLLAGPATSRAVTTTFTGVVDADDGSGRDLDVAGLFGGGDLQGAAIQATFSYNTALGVENSDGATFDEILGGPEFGGNVISQVSYAIGNFTYQYVPDEYQNLATQAVTPTFPGFLSFAAYSTATDQSFIQVQTRSAPSSLSTSFSGQADPGTAGANFTYFLPGQTKTGALDSITFDVTGVRTDAVSAAPEPKTWWLMIVGTAFWGGMLRWMRGRNRQLNSAFPA